MIRRISTLIVITLLGFAFAQSAKSESRPVIFSNVENDYKNDKAAQALLRCIVKYIYNWDKPEYRTEKPEQAHDFDNVIERVRNIQFEGKKYQDKTAMAGGPLNFTGDGPLISSESKMSMGFAQYLPYSFWSDVGSDGKPLSSDKISLGGEIRITLDKTQAREDFYDRSTQVMTCTSPQYKEAINIVENLKLILRSHDRSGPNPGPILPIPVETREIMTVTEKDPRAKLADRYGKTLFESTYKPVSPSSGGTASTPASP